MSDEVAERVRVPKVGDWVNRRLDGEHVGQITQVHGDGSIYWQDFEGNVNHWGPLVVWDEERYGWEDALTLPDQPSATVVASGTGLIADWGTTAVGTLVDHGGLPHTIPMGVTVVQFDRLLALLQLTEQERAFVCAALEPDAEADLWDVISDWLLDQNRPRLTKMVTLLESLAAEREACAQIAELFNRFSVSDKGREVAVEIARQIRARANCGMAFGR